MVRPDPVDTFVATEHTDYSVKLTWTPPSSTGVAFFFFLIDVVGRGKTKQLNSKMCMNIHHNIIFAAKKYHSFHVEDLILSKTT